MASLGCPEANTDTATATYTAEFADRVRSSEQTHSGRSKSSITVHVATTSLPQTRDLTLNRPSGFIYHQRGENIVCERENHLASFGGASDEPQRTLVCNCSWQGSGLTHVVGV